MSPRFQEGGRSGWSHGPLDMTILVLIWLAGPPWAGRLSRAARRAPLDRRLAVQLQAELGEERDSGLEIVDDDADVIHSLYRHGPSIGAG
jgi:hypothetical protein